MTRNKSYFGLLAMFLFLSNVATAQIVLNEYSAANLENFPDNYGKHEDWLELYNTDTLNEIDLSGWQLSDNPDKPDKWVIPQGVSIAPEGFLHLAQWP